MKGRPSPLKGEEISDEHKQKISNTMRGIPKSEEARHNMRTTQKKRREKEAGEKSFADGIATGLLQQGKNKNHPVKKKKRVKKSPKDNSDVT